MLDKLQDIAREAGRLIVERPEFGVEEKAGHANFVTDIDKKVQNLINKRLLDLLPQRAIIAEEQENAGLTDAPTWVVDPVDGTTNLIHDYRQSSISIALLRDKVPVTGLVYQPYTGEMFCAERGSGSYLNGRQIHVSTNPYSRALAAIGTSPYNPELARKSLALALEYLTDCSDIRRTGSAAIDLANLACGRTDIYFELTLKPWDFAAGALLVTEAGGRFCMPLSKTGTDFSSTNGVFAANPVCFEEALEKFKSVIL